MGMPGAGAIKQFCGIIACNKYAGSAVVWAFLLVTPFWLHSGYGYFIFASIVVTALAATSLNLLLGYTGVLSLGHAAFFGVGAYACALVLRSPVHSTALAVLTGTIVGGTIGVLFAAVSSPFCSVTSASGGACFRLRFVPSYSTNYASMRRAGGRISPAGLMGCPSMAGEYQPGPVHTRFFHAGRIAVLFYARDFRRWRSAWGLFCRSRFGRALTAIRDDTRNASLGGFGSSALSGCVFRYLPFSPRLPAPSMHWRSVLLSPECCIIPDRSNLSSWPCLAACERFGGPWSERCLSHCCITSRCPIR